MGKVPKDRWGTPQSDRRHSRPVLHVGFPPDPRYGGRFPEVVPRTRRGWYRRLSLLPRRCRWLGNLEKAVRLDGESAPGASSRRSWSIIGGRMISAPTLGLGIFAGTDGRRNAAPTQGAPPNPRRNHRLSLLNQVLNLPRRSAASQKAFLPTFFSEKSRRRAAPGSSPQTQGR